MANQQSDVQMAAILSVLTEPQQEAVRHMDGPLLILAGPGSGKTRVVTHRLAYLLLQGIPDFQLTALTFTNKAADEMRTRLDRLAPGNRVWLGTFHRFCAQLLRRLSAHVGLKDNFTILDTEDSRKLLKEAIADAGIDLELVTPGQIAHVISSAKSELITPEDFERTCDDSLGSLIQEIYPQYQRRLVAANAVDFDDLLMHTALLLKENPELRKKLDDRFRFIMVDEYQDTNLAQYAIVRALSVDHPNLAVTGDPDQSIYGWRGAAIRNILDFEKDYQDVHIVRLEQNYRSTPNILHVADQLIDNNTARKKKQLFTDKSPGSPVRIVVYRSGQEEAQTIAARIGNEVATGHRRPRDFAVFYRVNFLSRALERALRRVGLPYQIVRGLEFYQRKEIKDVIAYLQLMNNPANDVAFLRIINVPPRRIGKTTIAHLVAHARRYGFPLLDAARESGLISSLTKRAAVQVARFVALYDELCAHVHEPMGDIMEQIVDKATFRKWLAASTSEDCQRQLENIEELVTDAREFDQTHPEDGGLEAFLEETALVADADGRETGTDQVTLMTLHAAKGLEFPVVYIVAVEEETLPHARCTDDGLSLEEERRLLFVGITRAEQELQLSCARKRGFSGKERFTAPSRFLMELPHETMQIVGHLAHGFQLDQLLDDDLLDPDWFDSETDGECPTVDDRSPQPASATIPSRPAMPVMTAAELTGEQHVDPAPMAPDEFVVGTVVRHPEYGIGKVVVASGAGKNRTVSVQFAGPAGKLNFRVAYSPLRPAKT